MALRVAVASGNWSNPAIWNGGILPQTGDIVASNNFTVTIDQNINVDSLTNNIAVLTSLTGLMTSNTTPSGVVSASSILAPSYDPWKAFDGNAASSEWLTANNTTSGWLAYEFTSPKKVGKYIVVPPSSSSPGSVPRDWTFEAWDGTSWVVLDSVTGNSGTASVTRTFINTTAYIKYRINITLNNGSTLYTGIRELYLYEPYDYGVNSVAGGGFVLNSGVTLNLTSTLTSGIISGPSVCLIYSALSGLSTINGNILGSNSTDVQAINYTGAADLVINGSLASGSRYWGMTKSGTGTLTIVGNVFVTSGNNNNRALSNTGTGTINITGNITGQIGGVGHGYGIVNTAICTINITGDVTGGTGSITSAGITNSAAAYIYITGNVYGNFNNPGISSSAAHFLSIVGTISSNLNPTSNNASSVTSTSTSAINLFSGPFISSPYGTFPYQCLRMHLIPSASNYIEFRDETTNGALLPGPTAPATRMVAPASIVDAPAPSDVRLGTVYANGSQTGTCKIPAITAVAAGVDIDNTVGSAVLSPGDVWNALTSTMTTPDSIGERLKNASTVQTTGEQIASIN